MSVNEMQWDAYIGGSRATARVIETNKEYGAIKNWSILNKFKLEQTKQILNWSKLNKF